MLTLLLSLSAIVPSQPPGQSPGQSPEQARGEWIPAVPLTSPDLAGVTLVAAEGAWVAVVKEFALTERQRMFHAPRKPWQLLRYGPGCAGPRVLVEEEFGRSGWGAPTFLAIGVDGGVTASWRPGHAVLVAPPGEDAVRVTLHDSSGLSCAALLPGWIVHVDEEARTLSAREVSVGGAGEVRSLGAFGGERLDALVQGGSWIAWSEGGGRVGAVEVASGERRNVTLEGGEALEVDGIWNGRLLAHGFGHPARVHVVDLEAGAAFSFETPWTVRSCLPEGIFLGAGWFYDPVGHDLVASEKTPRLGRLQIVWRAPGEIWIQDLAAETGLMVHEWRVMHIGGPRVAIPPSMSRPAIVLPDRAQLGIPEAALAAWKSARGD